MKKENKIDIEECMKRQRKESVGIFKKKAIFCAVISPTNGPKSDTSTFRYAPPTPLPNPIFFFSSEKMAPFSLNRIYHLLNTRPFVGHDCRSYGPDCDGAAEGNLGKAAAERGSFCVCKGRVVLYAEVDQ